MKTRIKPLIVGLFILLLITIAPTLLFSHPHTFMDMKINVVTNSEGIEGFEIQWYFDFIFSSETWYECDWDGDGVLNLDEHNYIEYIAFRNLKNYHYFTTIKFKNKIILPDKYENFRAKMVKETLVYTYFIPFVVLDKDITDVSISVYDETFMCDIEFDKKIPFSIRGEKATEFTLFTKLEKEIVVNYDNNIIGSQRKNASYSGTFIPKFLHLKRK